MGQQLYDNDGEVVRHSSREGRRLKDIMDSSKKLSKGEIKGMVRSIMKEIMREELVNFMRTNNFLRDTIAEQLGEYLSSRDFAFVIERIIRDDIGRVRKTIEDVALSAYVEDRKKRRNRRSATPPAPRKIVI